MRLEDALLFVVFDLGKLPPDDIHARCSAAISVGADMIGLKFPEGAADVELLRAAARSCKEEDALFVAWDEPMLVEECAADGVHLSDAQASIGHARAMAGIDKLVGFSTNSAEEAMLAGEVGADYIVHTEGALCPAVFGQMRGGGTSYLYAGGFASVDEARGVVGNGVFRVCIEIDNEEDAKAESIAEYSRLFGRII